ncbi:MAG: peptidylprolyl isomerase [Actinomycetota bacterium]
MADDPGRAGAAAGGVADPGRAGAAAVGMGGDLQGRRTTGAARRAKLRRRRTARVAAVATTLAIVVALALSATSVTTEAPSESEAAAAPSLPEGCERQERRQPSAPSFDAPQQVLEAGRDLGAVIHTSCGDLALDLFEDEAPGNVNSFVFLARRGFYEGLPFHRVEKESVLQSGDPNGANLDPPDGPGYTVDDELASAHFDRYVYGVVGMANAGPDTAGSQFFIVVHDPEGALEGDPEPAGFRPRYTIIGRVDRSSWDTLARLASVDTKGGIDPVESVEPVIPVLVDSIDVVAR